MNYAAKLLRRILLFAGLGLAFHLAPHSTFAQVLDNSIKYADINAQFESLAFRFKFGIPYKSRVLKWKGPIVFGAAGSARHEFIPAIQEYAKHLEKFTKTPVSFKPQGNVNFPIAFVDDFASIDSDPLFKLAMIFFRSESDMKAEFSSKAGDGVCYLKSKGDLTGIKVAVLFVDLPISKSTLRSCLTGVATRAFGLSGDSIESASAFSYKRKQGSIVDFEAADEILVRIILDERIRTGMTKEETAPLVRQILSEQSD